MRKLRVKIKPAATFVRNQIKNKSLSKSSCSKVYMHTYQQYLKNKVYLQNTITYTTSLMFHRMA